MDKKVPYSLRGYGTGGILSVDSRVLRSHTGRGVFDYTISLRPFKGRTLMTLQAGLALNIHSSPVKGLTPLRAFLAGFRLTSILLRPGMVNTRGLFFLRSFLIIAVRQSKTSVISFLPMPVFSARFAKTSAFDRVFSTFVNL